MKREIFRDVIQVLILLVLGFVGFSLYQVHNDLRAVGTRTDEIWRDMGDTFNVHVDDTVQVEGSVSIDR